MYGQKNAYLDHFALSVELFEKRLMSFRLLDKKISSLTGITQDKFIKKIWEFQDFFTLHQ